MARESDDDLWLGSLHQFPAVLHARAFFSFEINSESLQKALMSAVSSLLTGSISKEISIADRDGYSESRLVFKIGIGDGGGFDFLSRRQEERVLGRIERLGPFKILDLAFQLHYMVDDGRKHKVHGDYYVVRLVFHPGQVEMLVHHGKGIRRVEPDELVSLILRALNSELARRGSSPVELETVRST